MQSHMVILIAYCIGIKKYHQTLLNFAILAGKRQKTHLFGTNSWHDPVYCIDLGENYSPHTHQQNLRIGISLTNVCLIDQHI